MFADLSPSFHRRLQPPDKGNKVGLYQRTDDSWAIDASLSDVLRTLLVKWINPSQMLD
jgi:hypothetical protein